MFLDGIFNKLSELKYAESIDKWYKNNTQELTDDFLCDGRDDNSSEESKADPLDEEPGTYISDEQKPELKEVVGECILSIKIENHGQYLMWQKLNGGGNRQWEFLVSYPAIMRGRYSFKTSLDVEIIAKKIVHLMQMGFNVYSANWQLREENKDDKIATETTP